MDPLTPNRSPSREVGWFLVLAFGGSWLVAGVGLLLFDLGEAGLGIGVLMVAVAALLRTRADSGSFGPILRDVVLWRFGLQWYATALLLPFVALAAALLLGPRFGGTGLTPDAPGGGMLLLLPLFVLFLGGPEELGWRGYALPRLQVRLGALAASLLLGGIWMVWHIPAFLVSDLFSGIPLIPYLVTGVASSVAYTWLYNSTSGSILVAMLLHGSTNLSLAWLPQSTPSYAVYAAFWVAIAVVLCGVLGPEHLSRSPRRREGAS